MRRNTVTYWTTADFANRETCSFIRLNDAFRKTLLQAAKKKSLINRSRKTTSTARADFKCHSVLWQGENYRKWQVGERWGKGVGKSVNSILNTCETVPKKSWRYLLANPDRSRNPDLKTFQWLCFSMIILWKLSSFRPLPPLTFVVVCRWPLWTIRQCFVYIRNVRSEVLGDC